MSKKAKGFSEVLVIIILALIVIAGIGYFSYKNGQVKLSPRLNNPTPIAASLSPAYSIPTPLPINWVLDKISGGTLYKNSEYNFEVKFPDTFVFIKPDEEIPGYIPVCEGKNQQFCLLYPESNIPKTNFAGAGFSVYVLDDKTSERECNLFGDENYFPKRSTSINGSDFVLQTRGSAASGHQETTDYYRTYHKNNCLEIDLRITTESRFENMPQSSGYKEFTSEQSSQVKKELNQILSTFKFLEN